MDLNFIVDIFGNSGPEWPDDRKWTTGFREAREKRRRSRTARQRNYPAAKRQAVAMKKKVHSGQTIWL